MPSEIQWEVKELKYFSRGFFKRLFIAIEAARSQGDVNHITGDVHFIAFFLERRKTVLTIHDLGLLQNRSFFVKWVLKLFWVTIPVKRAAVITTVSQATKDTLLSYVRTDPARIRVIHNPVSAVFKRELKVFNNICPRILQIGSKANKNVPRLIDAIKGLSCKLVIIGPLDAFLLQKIRDAGLWYENPVNLSNEEIAEQYISADIVSFASTNEGFGMPIIEANTVGRVVLTSNISCMPEIAGNAAHLVDPFDSSSIREGLEKIINEDAYRERLIVNGFENSKRFDVQTITRQYVDIYTSLHDARR